MKLSEAIARLAEMLEEHGDVETVLHEDWAENPVESVTFTDDGKVLIA